MFSVLGSLMPAVGRMGTSWASGKGMKKKCWRWPKGRSSGTGNVREDTLHQDELKCMASLGGKTICQTSSTYWMPTYPTNFLPLCCTWIPMSWLTNTCPLFVTLDLGSCQSPSAWCSFSPPGFACWLALPPRCFLSLLPACTQPWRCDSSTPDSRTFLSRHQPLPPFASLCHVPLTTTATSFVLWLLGK